MIRASHFVMPVSVQIDPFPIQLPAKMCLGRQQKDPAIGYLPATWETQIQFKAPALVWPSPDYQGHLENKLLHGCPFPPPIPSQHCCASQINKCKIKHQSF